jgi:hypothetical protein
MYYRALNTAGCLFLIVLVIILIQQQRLRGGFITFVNSKWLKSIDAHTDREREREISLQSNTTDHSHDVHRTSVRIVHEPPSSVILAVMVAMAFSRASTPWALSKALVVITYTGVASSLTLIGSSSVLHLIPSRKPSYKPPDPPRSAAAASSK